MNHVSRPAPDAAQIEAVAKAMQGYDYYLDEPPADHWERAKPHTKKAYLQSAAIAITAYRQARGEG